MPKSDNQTTPKAIESQAKPDPNDEFPISADVYCKIKRLNGLDTKIFEKAMHVENRYKKFYIKEWDVKFQEFYGRTV